MTNKPQCLTVRELVAGLEEVSIYGNGDVRCFNALPLRDAGPGCVTLMDDASRGEQVSRCGAVAVVTGQPIASVPCTQIVASDIHGVFTHLVKRFRPRRDSQIQYASIHSTAQIDPTASIGSGTRIDAGVVIGPDVQIGHDCHLMPGVVVMDASRIGDGCRIFPNVVIYEHTRIDNEVLIHAGSVIGGYGFGYRQIHGKHVATAQLGFVHIESNVDIGSNVTIDRGTYGATRIGEGTKIDNLVMIAHNCHIGRHNLICSQVGIAGSCATGDYVVLAGQVGLADHVTLGDQVVVGAQAGVMDDLDSNEVYLGSPATTQREQMQILAVQRRLPEMRREVKALRRQVDGVGTTAFAPDATVDDKPSEGGHDADDVRNAHCLPFKRPAA